MGGPLLSAKWVCGKWISEKSQYYYGDANLKAIFGYAPEELSPEPYAWLNLVSPGDRPIALNNWERMRDGTADMGRCELRMVKKDGSDRLDRCAMP